jgi:hypothetical protein
MKRFHFTSYTNERRQADIAHNPILQSQNSSAQKCNVFYRSPHKNLTGHLTEHMIVHRCNISKELLLNSLVPELNVCSYLQNLNGAYKTANIVI